MEQETPVPPPIRIFLSYAREDDEALNFARPLKRGIRQLVRAIAGRPVEMFLDRDDIPLGDDWNQTIESAVRQSYFFIPVYTGTYLLRPKCREEFLLFREVAEGRGVPSLIIPINLLGSESLKPLGEDEISDYVRAHQAAVFDVSWEDGPDSAPYRRNLLLIANRVLSAMPAIEDALALAEEADADEHLERANERATEKGDERGSPEPDAPQDEEDDDTDLLSLSAAIQANLESITECASVLGVAMENLGGFDQVSEKQMQSPRDANKYLIRVANQMREPALEIQGAGDGMLKQTRDCDLSLRTLVRMVGGSDAPELTKAIYEALAPGVASLAEVGDVELQISELLQAMKTPELLSASVRRALRPARQGVTKVQDSIRLMSDWPDLVETLAGA